MEERKYVYALWHVYEDESGKEQVKFIGIYSSQQAVDAAVERLRAWPGFFLYPEGFQADRVELDRDGWPEGFVRAFSDEG